MRTGTAGTAAPFIHGWLLEHAERAPASPAISAGGRDVSYGALAERALRLAGHLRDQGVRVGDRVLVASPNSTGSIVASLAVNLLGATAVEASSGGSAAALIEIAGRTRAVAAFLPARHLAAVREAVPALAGSAWQIDAASERHPVDGHGLRLGADGTTDPGLGSPAPITPWTGDPDRAALILFTSGSTGTPVGVVQTFANVNANTRSIVAYLGLTSADRALLILPLHYCYGRSVWQTHLFVGGSVVLEPRAAFPRTVLDSLARERCTGFAGVPVTFEIMRRLVDPGAIEVPTLRYLTQAGGGMDRDTIAWTRRAFAPARLFVMYGQTEATARLSYLPPEHAAAKDGSIGIPIPGVELRVVDDQGETLPDGEVGQLIARGDNITPGYLDDPEATAAILRDGWLWTGDLAVRDADGFLFHRGRVNELLKVGGRRVSPVEIEAVLARQPGVAEVAVSSRPDPIQGEVPVAFVVLTTGSTATAEQLRRSCLAELPSWMVPTAVTIVDALPRNEAGKLLRGRLLERDTAA